MSFMSILTSEVDPEEKLNTLVDFIDEIRKSYGTEKAELSMPDIYTSEGMKSFNLLSMDEQLAVVEEEVKNIRTAALEFEENVEGGSLKRKVEELVSINPFLCNLGTKKEIPFF